ncbi:hypothetical protein EJ07DRAFT_184359 [Lizonia empirigonia]|nr:hypothetical protein EJ07DRAFT_184359 [Lizonia empirigonia]
MKSFSLIAAAALAAGASAQYSAASMSTDTMSASTPVASAASAVSVTTTTATPGCPSAAPDVMVTRSDVPVPSCAAGSNATKPSIVSMSGYGPGGMASGSAGTGGSATASGMLPEFTGAAGRTAVSGALVVVGGVAAWFL